LTRKFKKLSRFRSKEIQHRNNPVDFVFHGGSGSTLEEIREGLATGDQNEHRY
jgi:fructose-bisphosphate aldolase class II